MSYDFAIEPAAHLREQVSAIVAATLSAMGVHGGPSRFRFEGERLWMGIDVEGAALGSRVSLHVPHAFWCVDRATRYVEVGLKLAHALEGALVDPQLDEVVNDPKHHWRRKYRTEAMCPAGLSVADGIARVRGFYATYVWDLMAGRLIAMDPAPPLESEAPLLDPRFAAPDGMQQASTVSADGRWIAVSHIDKTISVFDRSTGALRSRIQRCGVVYGLAFDETGERLLTGSTNKAVKVWDCATGKALVTLKGHEEQVPFVAWLDPQTVVSQSRWSMRVWNLGTSTTKLQLAATYTGEWVTLHASGRWTSSEGFRGIRWSNDARERVWKPGEGVLAASASSASE